MDNDDVLFEYQQVLLGRSAKIHPSYFRGISSSNERNALTVLRYAVEKILEWSPEEMYMKFSESIADRLKIKFLLTYIRIPPEATRDDYFIYAYILYPHKINLNREQLALIVYKRIITKTLRKYPKGFYDDEHGKFRAEVCLRYALTQNEAVSDIASLYEAFAGQEGFAILKRNRLTLALHYAWSSPLEYLHDALPKADKSELWYHFYYLASTMPNFSE